MSPMKKIFTTVAAMVLALAMSVTAFAAPSVTNNTTLPTETVGSVTYIRNYSAVTATATDANGNAVNLGRLFLFLDIPSSACRRSSALKPNRS